MWSHPQRLITQVCEKLYELSLWFEKLNYTQRAKIHLARAFIMNPEVMVTCRLSKG